MKKHIIYLIGFIGLFFHVYHGISFGISFDQAFKQTKNTPWQIFADSIRYEEGIYIAHGNVLIKNNNRVLTADHIFYNTLTMTIQALDNVMLTVDNDRLMGHRVIMNLNDETGTIYNGELLAHAEHFIIKSHTIQKISDHAYRMDDVSITACDGDNPDWRITGKNLNLEIDGYGSIWHVTFWIKKYPVLYFPYILFPVKISRQSGLLLPTIGYSDQTGSIYQQPLYWAINHWSDLTLYEEFSQKKGVKHGLEYRYMLSPRSKGSFYGDFISDRHCRNDILFTPNAFWKENTSELSFAKKDRYWVRTKINQSIGQFVCLLDGDISSDPFFVQDFNKGYTGYDTVNSYFIEKFGRDINPMDDLLRESRLTIYPKTKRYYMNIQAIWYDHLLSKMTDLPNNALNRLPSIQIGTIRSNLGNWPFMAEASADYVQFYRETGLDGHQFTANTRLSLPLHLKHFLFIEPSIHGKGLVWHAQLNPMDDEHYETSTDNLDSYESNDNQSLLTYQFQCLFQTELNKKFRFTQKGDAYKHIILPEFLYEYAPAKRTILKNVLDSDEIETMMGKHQIKWSLTQFIQSTHKEIGWLRISQSYDIMKAKDELSDDNDKPFSHLFGEFEFNTSIITLNADAEWSIYTHQFHSASLSASWMSPSEQSMVKMSYYYQKNSNQSLITEGYLNLTRNIDMKGLYEYDWIEAKRIQSRLSLGYESQCWRIDLNYIDETIPPNRSYSFMIHLTGFGDQSSNF